MDADGEEEEGEVFGVTVADAGAYPGAVMVMNFYAHTTVATVKCPRRPHELARATIAEDFMRFIVFFTIQFVSIIFVFII